MARQNIIVIGTSAGGVEALCELTSSLPKGLDAAVFVVMHIGGDSALAEILTRCGNLPAVSAQDRQRYERACIYVAPPLHHLALKDGLTILSRGPRENGHRPSVDVLFRSAAREHRAKVIGVILSGGRDDGTAGLFSIKARGGVAVVQDPAEAFAPDMPRSALANVDVDYCLPLSQIANTLVELVHGKATGTTEVRNGETNMENDAYPDQPTGLPPGDQIPVSCPDCNGPLFEVKEGELARFQCFLGHAYSPQSLSQEHTDALERALWTAIRKLKERIVMHERLLSRKQRNNSEEELRSRLAESMATAEKDITLLRDVIDRI